MTIEHEQHLFFFCLLVRTDSRLEKELLFCFLSATLGIVYEICQTVTQNGPYNIFYSCDFFFLHQIVGETTHNFPNFPGRQIAEIYNQRCLLVLLFFKFKTCPRKCNEDRWTQDFLGVSKNKTKRIRALMQMCYLQRKPKSGREYDCLPTQTPNSRQNRWGKQQQQGTCGTRWIKAGKTTKKRKVFYLCWRQIGLYTGNTSVSSRSRETEWT